MSEVNGVKTLQNSMLIESISIRRSDIVESVYMYMYVKIFESLWYLICSFVDIVRLDL